MKLVSIRLDGGTQSRTALSEDTIRDYKESIEDGITLPHLHVMFDGVDAWLVDGFHRWHAYRQAGVDDVSVHVESGTRRDAILASLRVNSDHGLPRSHADKRKAITTMLSDPEWQKWSISRIAEACRVSRSLVSSVVDSQSAERPAKALVERNGKVYEQQKPERKVEQAAPAPSAEPPILQEKQDEDQELAHLVSDLNQENESLRQQLAIRSGGDESERVLTELQQQILVMQAELSATRNTRDDLARENAELKKQVAYWRKKFDAASSVSA